MDNTDRGMLFETGGEIEARRMYRRVLACWAGDLMQIRARGLDTPRRRGAVRGWPAAPAATGAPIAGDPVDRAVPAWRPEPQRKAA